MSHTDAALVTHRRGGRHTANPADPARDGPADTVESMLLFVRVLLPLGFLLTGLVLLAVPGTWHIGLGLIGLAAIAWLANFLIRLTMSSQDDREREEEARKRFARTGRWSSK